MKRLFAIAALLFVIPASAQVVVQTKKQVKISDRERKTIEATVQGGDTTFVFCFPNARYSTISSYECARLSKADLKDFVDAMVELSKDKYKAEEASVDLGDIRVEKAKIFGAAYLRVLYKQTAWTSYRPGQAYKVQDEVYEFLGLPLVD